MVALKNSFGYPVARLLRLLSCTKAQFEINNWALVVEAKVSIPGAL